MKRVKWPFAPKKIAAVEALPGLRLRVNWEDGTQAEVSLSDWIESKGIGALTDSGLFAKAHVGEYASTVAWIDDELEIDSTHLQLLESEQRGMPLLPDALIRWRARHGLTQSLAAKALGVSLRQWQNYEAGKTFLPWVLALACAGWESRIKENTASQDATSQAAYLISPTGTFASTGAKRRGCAEGEALCPPEASPTPKPTR